MSTGTGKSAPQVKALSFFEMKLMALLPCALRKPVWPMIAGNAVGGSLTLFVWASAIFIFDELLSG